VTNRIALPAPSVERTILDRLLPLGLAGLDQLRLMDVPFVPGVRLHLAQDPIVLRARLEAEAGQPVPPPFWADAWVGGQAVARYLMEHPEEVAGRRVLDVAAGSGLLAVAAAKAGAASVTANDIDPYALAAISLNARVNDVVVTVISGELLGGHGGDAEVVLAGDVFYNRAMADRMLRFLERAAARGASVLVGDPGRAYVPHDRLTPVASYRAATFGAPEDAEIDEAHVYRLRT